jgi:hypothetical protein
MSVLPTRQQPDAWRLWQVCFRLLDRLSANPTIWPSSFLTPALLRLAPGSGASGRRSGRHHPWPGQISVPLAVGNLQLDQMHKYSLPLYRSLSSPIG